MDSDKGFLTPTDREFLRGEKEYDSKQGRYARRQAIRERIQNSLRDFVLLFEYLDSDEIVRIFGPDNYPVGEWGGVANDPERTTPEEDERRERTPNTPPESLEGEFEDQPSFFATDDDTDQIELKAPEDRPIGIYEGMVDSLALLFKSFYERDVSYPEVHVEQLVESALRRILADRNEELHDFEFSYRTSPLDVEELRERLFSGGKLTYDEFETLQKFGQFVNSEGEPIDISQMVDVQHMAASESLGSTSEEDETTTDE